MKAIDKLYVRVCAECNKNCPSDQPYRCCDKDFCNIVRATYRGEQPNVGGLPFMGPNGCVVPPEFRQQCTGFVCQQILEDRKFRREYERLCEKAGIQPARRRE